MMSNHQIVIDYDDKLKKLLIKAPFFANDIIKGVPSVRWNKTHHAWAAPLIKKNIEEIEKKLNGLARITPAAAEMMAKAKEQAEQIISDDVWPFWYRYKTEPRNYQKKCNIKLYPVEANAIISEPGTGKSKMAIDMFCARRMEGKIGTLLIICKLTLRDNWVDQIREHATIPMQIYLPSTDKKKQFKKWAEQKHEFPVVIVGTESFSAGGMADMIREYLLTAHKPAAILDESSMISTHSATRSQQIVGLRDLLVYRTAMTGTPFRDSPLNMFMQFEFLDPQIIGVGDFYAFRNRYAVMGGFMLEDKSGRKRPTQVVGYQNLDELAQTVGPYVFQITKEEAGLDLPPKRYQKRVISMTKDQRAMYDALKKDGAWRVAGEDQMVQSVLEAELRMHQICGGFTTRVMETERTVNGEERVKKYYEPIAIMDHSKNPKIIELLDILQEFKDQQIIVWCMYRPEIDAIRKAMIEAGFQEPAMYHGGVSDADRAQHDDAFKKGDKRVMLANPQTGSMGLTWVSKDAVVVYYSNSNKLEDRIQSEDRAHRIGSTGDSVMYIDLIMGKSVDILRKSALDAKSDLSNFVRSIIRRATITDLLDGEGIAPVEAVCSNNDIRG